MLRFLKSILGSPARPAESSANDHTLLQDSPEQISPDQEVVNGYYLMMEKFRRAISDRQYDLAARYVRESLPAIPVLVRETRREFGSFDIASIPVLEQGGTILALLGDSDTLTSMRSVVSSDPELLPWVAVVDDHEGDLRLFRAIMAAVTRHPGCLQSEVKDLIDEADGRRVATLISWLEKAGRIRRAKKGKTYTLNVVLAGESTMPAIRKSVKSHRTDQGPIQCVEIDLDRLPYVPLPRSPATWATDASGDTHPDDKSASESFELHETNGWKLISVQKIPAAERPDPAYRRFHPVDDGIILLDDLGKSAEFANSPAAALRFGRSGQRIAGRGFDHDAYRVGTNAMGQGMIAMSSDCVIHAYDDAFRGILETNLRESPEVQALRRRFDIGDKELKNHLRCVALSDNLSRYLVTGVDEAWCVDMTGRGLWGLKLPPQEGWSRITERSDQYGTAAEISSALQVVGLTFPYSAEELKRRYRELAKRWHPDLNPGNHAAEEQMKRLTKAAEILTGVDSRALSLYTPERFRQEFGRETFRVDDTTFTVSIGFEMNGVHAADWIYAAGFAAETLDVFLAGYSGRVVQVDNRGAAMRAYDIGAVPRRIVETGDFLYLLTDTRLYVLRGDAAVAIIDTLNAGDLIVAQTGFGLLEPKRFRWFHEDGALLGSLLTKDPIRRVYQTDTGMVVETRQQRAIIAGVPIWWE